MKANARITYSFIISLVTLTATFAQADYPHLREGDDVFSDGRYPDAETAYRKALAEKQKGSTSYNLANSMFLQNRIPEAIMEYQKAIETTEDPSVKSQAFYNMGNAYFQNSEYQQSILAYKEALKINPADEDAKKNLMLAMRQLKQEQQQQQSEEQQQEQQEQEQQQKEQQQKEQQQQQQQQQQQEQQKEDVSKEEASEILKAIEREDQRVQEKLKKTKGKTTPPVKDW